MLTLEYKLDVKPAQATAIDEAIRTVQFIRNKCACLWMDATKDHPVDRTALQAYCAVLANEFLCTVWQTGTAWFSTRVTLGDWRASTWCGQLRHARCQAEPRIPSALARGVSRLYDIRCVSDPTPARAGACASKS